VRRYVCSRSVGHHGCGKIAVLAEPLEELITAAVLLRLDSPAVAAALAGTDADTDDEAATARQALEADLAQLEELATAYGNRELTMANGQPPRPQSASASPPTNAASAASRRPTAVTGS
jgi:site-specific DNA recombinase